MTQSGYEVQDCCRTIFFISCPLFLMYVVFVVFMSGCFNFSNRYFAPRYCLRRFRFFKSWFSRLKIVSGGFYFSKTSASRLKNIYDGLNVFQKPALQTSKPSTMVLIFQKSALHTSIPPTAVPIYSKTGDSRCKNSVCCSLKKTQ